MSAAHSVGMTTVPTVSPEEKLEDLQHRYQLLQGERRSNLEVAAQHVRTNKETIRKLSVDNNKLRSDISKEKLSTRSQKDSVEETLRLKAKLNALRSDNARKEELLSELKLQVKVMRGGSKLSIEEADEKQKKLRVVENRIDKAMIKLNEAQSIKKTYEGILERLREERVGFDKQLRELEAQLESKKKDMQELIMLSHDAQHAKEMAQAELHKFEQAVLEERDQRDREVMEKKILVQQRLEMNQRMEKMAQQLASVPDPADKPAATATKVEDKADGGANLDGELRLLSAKICEYEEAYAKVKEITGVGDVNEIIQKYVMQQETFESLSRQVAEQQRKVDEMTDEHKRLKSQLDEAKYSSAAANRKRTATEDMESLIFDSQQRLNRAKARFEKLSRLLVDINTGVSHLHSKLADVQLEGHSSTVSATTHVTDETLEEVLSLCEQKILKLMATTGEGPPTRFVPQQADVRVRQAEVIVDDTEYENGDENETNQNRRQIKLNSQQFVEKMKKKQTSK
jgi:chromosome segregation ATPase